MPGAGSGTRIGSCLDLAQPTKDRRRWRHLYGRHCFDGISADAWYAKGPFLRAIDMLGWLRIVVLKREDMEIYVEAFEVGRGQKA